MYFFVVFIHNFLTPKALVRLLPEDLKLMNFSVPGRFFDMCMIPLELKTLLPFGIYPTSSQMPQNLNL